MVTWRDQVSELAQDDLDGLLDTVFEQIRHYGASDVVVSLRLLRALGDIASTVREPHLREVLKRRAQAVLGSCEPHLPMGDVARLRDRLSSSFPLEPR